MENILFRLIDRKVNENSFFLNSDGTHDTDKKLDFTNTYGVLNPFFITETGGKRVYYRYIAGVDILEMAEQEKQKMVFNKDNGLVEFKAGADIVLDKELGGILAKFLSIHPHNTSSPNHKKGFHDAIFFTYDPNAEVENEFNQAQAEDEATDILRELKDNPSRLRDVAALFSETSGLTGDQAIYLGLRRLAKENPERFTSSISSRKNQVLSDVLIAEKMGLIQKDAKGWIFSNDGGQILATTTKNREVAQGELVEFFLSGEGEFPYRELIVKKQHMEIDANGPAKPTEVKPEYDTKGQIINQAELDLAKQIKQE